MEQNTQYIEEGTIDIRELFSILTKRKKLIWLITAFFTLLALAYVFIAKPVYEVKTVIELAKINQKLVHSTATIKHKIETLFEVDIKNKKIKYPIISKVTIPKKTNDLLNITAQGHDNPSAEKKLNEAWRYLYKKQIKKIESYKNLQNKKLLLLKEDITQNNAFIQDTKKDIIEYENKLLNISKQDAVLAGIYAIEISKKQTELNMAINKKYDLENEINRVLFSLSPYKLQKPSIIGEIQTLEDPIKPKKMLIVIVAFITGLMLAVFLAFFLEFLRESKKVNIT